MDWPKFWGQFTETFDKADIALLNKFTYLSGLLDAKVRCAVEALPLTSEGYNRAKSILQEKYGKESEVIKAYFKEIMDLPNAPSANAREISELLVQALETMTKLDQVNGSMPRTMEKLPAIREVQERTDPDCGQRILSS